MISMEILYQFLISFFRFGESKSIQYKKYFYTKLKVLSETKTIVKYFFPYLNSFRLISWRSFREGAGPLKVNINLRTELSFLTSHNFFTGNNLLSKGGQPSVEILILSITSFLPYLSDAGGLKQNKEQLFIDVFILFFVLFFVLSLF